jgi:succinyl-diaminopimelate desuccinylase
MFDVLAKLFPRDEALKYARDTYTDYTGTKWGINLQDADSGSLTCNIGVVRVIDGELKLVIDVRFPVTFDCEFFTKLVTEKTKYPLEDVFGKDPLYVRAESELVRTLLDVYDGVMGGKNDPLAIGGGTYSRCLSNCVAFGPLFPNEVQTIHMPNEYIVIENFKKQAELYMNAIRELSR